MEIYRDPFTLHLLFDAYIKDNIGNVHEKSLKSFIKEIGVLGGVSDMKQIMEKTLTDITERNEYVKNEFFSLCVYIYIYI